MCHSSMFNPVVLRVTSLTCHVIGTGPSLRTANPSWSVLRALACPVPAALNRCSWSGVAPKPLVTRWARLLAGKARSPAEIQLVHWPPGSPPSWVLFSVLPTSSSYYSSTVYNARLHLQKIVILNEWQCFHLIWEAKDRWWKYIR